MRPASAYRKRDADEVPVPDQAALSWKTRRYVDREAPRLHERRKVIRTRTIQKELGGRA